MKLKIKIIKSTSNQPLVFDTLVKHSNKADIKLHRKYNL